MKKLSLGLIAVVLATTTGCAMTVKDSFARYAADRAAFDLECPKEKIALVPLNVPLDSNVQPGAQVGVKGCGKRAVYVAAMGAGWVLNGGSEGPSQAAADEAPSAKKR